MKEKDTKQSVFTLIYISFAFSATAEMFANVMKPDCENVLSRPVSCDKKEPCFVHLSQISILVAYNMNEKSEKTHLSPIIVVTLHCQTKQGNRVLTILKNIRL